MTFLTVLPEVLVTVVVPAYNHERYIIEALDSVRRQTISNWELIVIDDGSTDGTWSALMAYKANFSDTRIQFIRQVNAGSHATLNRGLSMATTPYLTILNSDDVYAPERLERLLAFAGTVGEDFFASTGVRLIDEKGDVTTSNDKWLTMYRGLVDQWNSNQSNANENPAVQALLWGNFTISTSNFFMSRSVWTRVGPFRPLRYVPDWDYALRVALEFSDSFFFLPNEALLDYRLHGLNTILGGVLRNHIEAITLLREFLKKWAAQGHICPPHAIDRLHHLYRSLRHQQVFHHLERQKAASVELLDSAKEQINLIRFESDQRLQQIMQLQAESVQRLQYVSQLLAAADQLQQHITQLQTDADQRQQQVSQLQIESVQRLQQVTQLGASVDQLQQRSAQLQSESDQRQQQVLKLQAELDLRLLQITQFLNSKSWKLTEPLRDVRRVLSAVQYVVLDFLRSPYSFLRKTMANTARQIWSHLPTSQQYKQRVKFKIFSQFPNLFKWSQAYKNWQSISTSNQEPVELHSHLNIDFEYSSPSNSYVPLLTKKKLPLPDLLSIRLIAFYLPQFHAIPENNKWWGEGFTEWTNVKSAQPQFSGHYQPRIPGDLDYYNLLDINVQHQQVELAKLYGVGAFCFYTYWFAGKLLLEKPVENYLENKSINFPFCLCWANENWSRRWDGLDSHTLIEQRHSPEDDLNFIKHFKKYLVDKRYVCIDGKPLLLVYRPNLLPNAKQTSDRWREWCRQNGVGEIFLAYTQSFEVVDPGKYGFDAAIEFPPINASPQNITNSVAPLGEDFGCSIYDWSTFVKRSKSYQKVDYKLFRGVNPAWDNTARRKNKSSVLLNSSPCGYQEWLTNAIAETCNQNSNKQERLIFINAWNEWAEGAYLEPDQRYGYAYLEATRLALLKSELILQRRPIEAKVIAIVIHAYYIDVFLEILKYINNISDMQIKLYITTTQESEYDVRSALNELSFDFHLLLVENKGRDILPFLKILPIIVDSGHDFLIKVHTKKSLHRTDGDEWRNDIYSKLMNSSAIAEAKRLFHYDSKIGILGPDGHLVPMSYYWGSNAKCVSLLAARMGVTASVLSELNFVAGSMFFARTNALIPLLNLAINDSEYEAELGQTDGTLAHAIERLFAVSAHSIQLNTTCPSNVRSTDYQFAAR